MISVQTFPFSLFFGQKRRGFIFLTFVLFFQTFHLTAQDARLLKRANKAYTQGSYAVAIPLFEKMLIAKASAKTEKGKQRPMSESRVIVLKTKLANCYRILNQAEKAAPLFKSIVEKETLAKPIDFYNYGEVLMMLGKYDSAKIQFQAFAQLNPDDPLAQQALLNAVQVKNWLPLFPSVQLMPFALNTAADENSPLIFREKMVFASDRNSGFKLFKGKNTTTGRDFINLWEVETPAQGTVFSDSSAFQKPRLFSYKVNETQKNTANASISADGSTLVFCQNNRDENRSGNYFMQIYSANSTDSGQHWRQIERLDFCSPDVNYLYPCISPDGKTLFFAAERADGKGGLDLYASARNTKNEWSRPQNLGEKVNSSGHESFPFAASSDTLYFCSKGWGGFGGFDIFRSLKNAETGEWSAAQNLGTPFNSSYDDLSFCFSPTKKWGAFASNRAGMGDDIFFFNLANLEDATAEKVKSSEAEKQK
jgi:tetratricopeptide (TPR) repeat protein